MKSNEPISLKILNNGKVWFCFFKNIVSVNFALITIQEKCPLFIYIQIASRKISHEDTRQWDLYVLLRLSEITTRSDPPKTTCFVLDFSSIWLYLATNIYKFYFKCSVLITRTRNSIKDITDKNNKLFKKPFSMTREQQWDD